jgi:hypothetical protein
MSRSVSSSSIPARSASSSWEAPKVRQLSLFGTIPWYERSLACGTCGSINPIGAPPSAWLRAADGGYEVELVAGEEGVSPGQACVFYDAPAGQARVLGGGFIQSATAKRTTAKVALRPQPLVEAVRG